MEQKIQKQFIISEALRNDLGVLIRKGNFSFMNLSFELLENLLVQLFSLEEIENLPIEASEKVEEESVATKRKSPRKNA